MLSRLPCRNSALIVVPISSPANFLSIHSLTVQFIAESRASTSALAAFPNFPPIFVSTAVGEESTIASVATAVGAGARAS